MYVPGAKAYRGGVRPKSWEHPITEVPIKTNKIRRLTKRTLTCGISEPKCYKGLFTTTLISLCVTTVLRAVSAEVRLLVNKALSDAAAGEEC
mmetsp:Transcript_43311/g.70558  ORF Transcript_43311/g.70558 Transcript_43311/m.70558 type:complete len:92 (-) Transcript_43311:547-822(-)